MILLIDNYDSFVHNLARYLQRFDCDTHVVRNDAITIDEIVSLTPQAIVMSPGPCTPELAGWCLECVRHFSGLIPLLGVCLGHQAVCAAFGAEVVRAPVPCHGQASPIRHSQEGVFRGLPNPLTVGRYHSLVVDQNSVPPQFAVTAESDDGLIMGVQHKHHLTVGLQFHPESILTKCGYPLLQNFLEMAGLDTDGAPCSMDELEKTQDQSPPLPDAPVTF